ncbi:MAG: tetratricopeptide repeat protein [Planctomycetes bacterium]|nr:tetratricopeptide repeat protein [Planctomycetota bacterium]
MGCLTLLILLAIGGYWFSRRPAATSDDETSSKDARGGAGQSPEVKEDPAVRRAKAEESYHRAEGLCESGSWQEAIRVFRELANAYPETEWAPKARTQAVEIDECRRWLLMGKNCIESGNSDGAAREFQKVLDKYPQGRFVAEAKAELRAIGR